MPNDKIIEKFNSQFKKKYSERTDDENIIIFGLFKIETKDLGAFSLGRYLGSIESILIINKILEKGANFNYKSKEKKFLFTKYIVKETYREFIVRLSMEFLSNRGII